MAEANPISKDINRYTITAAIDFGTTYSGYAFSFNSGARKGEILLNKNWGTNLGTETFKAPTCVLTINGEFRNFGYEALEQYCKVTTQQKESGRFQLYKHFKMHLHTSKSVCGDMTIKSIDGCERRATDIVQMTLRYLKTELLMAIRKENRDLDETDILWVLSIPAIWSVRSKQFMRKAAFQAGLIKSMDSMQLVLSLEPEAAALYCQRNETNLFKRGPEQLSMDGKVEPKFDFKTLTTFMVIDAGGGTVDITAYEIDVTGGLREIHYCTGGPWGGTLVDSNFEELMKQIMGRDFIERFIQSNAKDWLKFMIQFERAKQAISRSTDTGINLDIPLAMFMKYSKDTGGDIGDIVKTIEKEKIDVTVEETTLIIKYTEAKKLFDPVVEKITSHVSNLLEDQNLKDIKYIILVGGFGQCEILQSELYEIFHTNYKILMPLSAQMAIIKGAVQYGQTPEQVKSRIARKTYGCDVHFPFKDGIHDVLRKEEIEGGILCKDCFEIYVQKGESVDVGSVKTFTNTPVKSIQTAIEFIFYCTDKPDPLYVDEEGVEEVGMFEVEMPDTTLGIERKIETCVTFGGTELLIECREITREGSEVVKTTLDFLSVIDSTDN